MTRRRRRTVIGMIAAFSVLLTACSGLPTTGEVKSGLALDDVDLPPDISQIAAGPLEGASPEEIVEGFLDAALTPADGWKTAREFLSPDLAETWRPSAGVTIDSGAAAREFTADVTDGGDAASEGDVRVLLDQTARVDEFGAYTELSGDTSVVSFEVAKNADGEWRITVASDGVILDAEAFPQVYRSYALHFYDQSWTHLLPDVRWYPRRGQIATTLTQALLSGTPSAWLAPAVRSAFPSDVSLARDSVPVDTDKVATVELTTTALTLDATALSRMRTQLEETLRPAGVTEVRLMVNGRDLNAGRATIESPRAETGTVVLTDSEFGLYLGDEIAPYAGISEELVELAASVVSVDVAADDTRAAVQLDDGGVYTVADGRVDQLDSRAGLLEPTMDPYGYTWTVPSANPRALTAWQPDVTPLNIANAFPDASSISQLRVGPDGVRVAAVATIGMQRWLVVAAIVRDEDHVPIELGPVHMVAQLDGQALGMSWVAEDDLSVLVDSDGSRVVLTQDVGGTGLFAAAPGTSISISGGSTSSAVRILDADGVLFAQRGTTWQMGLTDVLVLGTHAGQ
ncbi:LpqB family beta-propeller domain-containing protein [Microbacterium murale]|uniref:GerMN domain-containing protein n=1 Tax=Microbacterium murale TaxID=1081040 RepID=A0ABU0PCM7_9MICO|nr:LpqB family beta-propeller domain-containing protein [Microbacterium murale]MDQ0645089.1 hypothetical protein [Microbacterium murale]